MTGSARAAMEAGDWYSCLDPELEAMRARAYEAVHEHSTMMPAGRGPAGPKLRALLGGFGRDALIEAPFHCAYGVNIHLADNVFLNAGCVILDTAPVRIGTGSMLGPGVHIYCADHHRDRTLRAKGLERALPVTLGADVWIGGGAILLPGVSIGEGAVVGAGSVVTRDVPAGARVASNPARIIG